MLSLGRDLGIEACDLLSELRDTALQKVLLAVTRARTSFELRLLRRQEILHGALVQARRHFGRNFRQRQAVALGNQSCHPGPRFVELLAHHLKTGLRLGRVEPQQQIADVHSGAIVDGDLRHNPAGWMLNGLDVRLNHQIARNHDGARQRHQRHPATAQNEGDKQHPKSGPQLILVGASGPQRQGIARRVVAVGQGVAIDQKGDACADADAAPLNQLSNGRLGRDIAGWTRKRQSRLIDRRRLRNIQSGMIDGY